MDMNDSILVFETEDDNNEIHTRENNAVGTYISKVNATRMNNLSYGILNINPVLFEMEHFIGVVTTTKVLHYETMKHEWRCHNI